MNIVFGKVFMKNFAKNFVMLSLFLMREFFVFQLVLFLCLG